MKSLFIAMKTLFRRLVNFDSLLNASAFSLINSKFNKIDCDISDFFAFRLDGYETVFIAENNLAILSGQHIKCTHLFHFFDIEGDSCGVFEAEDDKFSYRLEINKSITNGREMGGFTHHIKYPGATSEKYSGLLSGISFQHRGYTGFRKLKDFGYSYMHGNFGGLYFDKNNQLKSYARLRGKHVYMPQLIIKSDYSYDFLFSNPTNKNVSIKFFLLNDNSLESIEEALLPPYATHKTTLIDTNIPNNCNISWETNFPIGRCIIFEYNESDFDVFHS